jgi:hypothetical protein
VGSVVRLLVLLEQLLTHLLLLLLLVLLLKKISGDGVRGDSGMGTGDSRRGIRKDVRTS